ncbi:protein of unknown function [Candidatus Nitrosocosmicus franklandus]|uniref:Uncharacterized protein n=1 Tax=Candidatus Nitrosocosmicus franklandianus TaxID=1798806 RepID=A0A484IEQ8_9ARCH|nr:protein of unknown function [Candidatus Nitrosocosmicus franklandus]
MRLLYRLRLEWKIDELDYSYIVAENTVKTGTFQLPLGDGGGLSRNDTSDTTR